jgi:hypothetical protein
MLILFYHTKKKLGKTNSTRKKRYLSKLFFSDETVQIKYQWNLDRFLAYITSWSGYVNYMQKYPDKDILLDLRRE